MIEKFMAGDITTQLIRNSKSCWKCENKMLGIFSYILRTKCRSCSIKTKCESPMEILDRLKIINR